MEPQSPLNDFDALTDALNSIRDSWVLISLALKDHLADTASPKRDEVLRQVEQCFSRLN